jgi:hypothetical protein
VIMIQCVPRQGDPKLAQIAPALGSVREALGPRQGRQKQGREHGDDRDDHQKFYESKTSCSLLRRRPQEGD